MSHIGSVFLGDVQRHRHLSSSTPPSSPPPHLSPTAPYSFSDVDLEGADDQKKHKTKITPPSISPILSLELRLRWLETLLLGAKHDAHDSAAKARATGDNLKDGETLTRQAEDLQRRLDGIAQSSDALKRFMDRYEQYSHMLSPAFALSGSLPINPPTYENMSPGELDAFLGEMEPDIRAAERDLREINALEGKGVLGAGKLSDYEVLQPRLGALQEAHADDLRMAADLERRIAHLMDHYATNVDTLSELFVSWDDTARDAQEEIDRLEKDREERRRLGYE